MKEDFEAKNKQLLEEMPKFYSSRIDYFKPSFESLIRAQVRCCPFLVPGSCPVPQFQPCLCIIHWNSMALSIGISAPWIWGPELRSASEV